MAIKKVVLITTLAIAGGGLASLSRCEVWDGGFLQAEYRINFLDENNHPLKDVRLRVLDSRGNIAFGYPVTDFTEDSIPTSDENGIMIFHHISLSPEFGGSCWRLFFMFPIGKCEAPSYTLQFLLSGEPVSSFGYTDLEAVGMKPDWKSLPIITRKWDQKSPSHPQLPEHLRIENRSLPSHFDFFIIRKTITVPYR